MAVSTTARPRPLPPQRHPAAAAAITQRHVVEQLKTSSPQEQTFARLDSAYRLISLSCRSQACACRHRGRSGGGGINCRRSAAILGVDLHRGEPRSDLQPL
jgi:hypothetical protein